MKTGYIHRKSMNPCGLRFDSSYHLSDGVAIKRVIASSPYPLMLIGKASDRIFIGGRARRVYVKDREHGIPFLSSSDILQADLENVKLASKKYTSNVEEMKLQKGWTLITRSGTIGNCAFANAKHAQKLASEDVIRLVPNNILREGYIYAYLASKQGYSLLTQGTFGAVIQHIEPAYVASLPIPVFSESFQQEVDDLIQESAKLREEAADVLQQAIQQIEKIIPYPAKKNVKCVSSRTILSSHNKRFEANYYISEGHDIEEYIYKHFTWKPLGEVCEDISRPDIFKRYYVQNGIVFLGGADIFLSNPDSKKQLSKSKTANINSLTIKENTILIPRSGTIGNVAWAHAGHAQKLASEDVIRLQPNDILKGGYIYAFLSSSIGKALIQKHIFGSVIQHIEPPHLKLIPIPIIEDSIIDDIHNWVIEYSKKVGMAIEKEKKAISMVEQEIDSWSARKEN